MGNGSRSNHKTRLAIKAAGRVPFYLVESTCIHPAVDRSTIATHPNKVVGMLAFTNLMNLGDFSFTALTGGSLVGICTTIVGVAVKLN